MENIINKSPKNHWSKNKVDSAVKKINNEIYKRNRQAPLQIKIDDLSIFINDVNGNIKLDKNVNVKS